MRDKTISATNAARSFSEVLDQVQFRDMSFSIERGKKIIARLVPAVLPEGIALADLNRLFAGLPHLGPGDSRKWRLENKTARKAGPPQIRKWA